MGYFASSAFGVVTELGISRFKSGPADPDRKGVKPSLQGETLPQSPAPGWYVDPTDFQGYRWWDGQAWTEHAAAATPPAPPAPVSTPTYSGFYGGSATTAVAQQTQRRPVTTTSGWERNRYAFITIGIVAAYILLAMKAHVYVLGILPIMMSARSKSRNEPLAIVAIIVAVVAVIFAIAGLSHH
jgi:hypothetical protein